MYVNPALGICGPSIIWLCASRKNRIATCSALSLRKKSNKKQSLYLIICNKIFNNYFEYTYILKYFDKSTLYLNQKSTLKTNVMYCLYYWSESKDRQLWVEIGKFYHSVCA